jgi:hypothetical protein
MNEAPVNAQPTPTVMRLQAGIEHETDLLEDPERVPG